MIGGRFIEMYVDGFRNLSSLGKTLWLIIAVKLIVIFVIVKLLFFPNVLKRDYATDAERSEAVMQNLTNPR